MEFFRIKKDIPFMSYAGVTSVISVLTFVAALWFLFAKGLNLGVDFTGGTVMEVSTAQAADLSHIRSVMHAHGYADATVQNFGTTRDVLIRLPLRPGVTSAELSEKVLAVLNDTGEKVQLRRVEFVGPQVGQELVNDGGLALLLVSVGIMFYLAIRFEWRFAVGAIIATIHDVLIILGCFAYFSGNSRSRSWPRCSLFLATP